MISQLRQQQSLFTARIAETACRRAAFAPSRKRSWMMFVSCYLLWSSSALLLLCDDEAAPSRPAAAGGGRRSGLSIMVGSARTASFRLTTPSSFRTKPTRSLPPHSEVNMTIRSAAAGVPTVSVITNTLIHPTSSSAFVLSMSATMR